MSKLIQKYPIVCFCILTALMLLPNLEVLSVSIMEARNFITAREMLTDGNWLLTTLNGEARYQKPPLPTWLSAISASIFGIKSVFGMRLPAVLMLILVGSFTYLLSVKLVGDKLHSIRNGFISLTSFYIIAITFEAPSDIFTHGFMLVAIYHLFQLFQKKNDYWKHTLIAGLFIGFSILSKGPVSIYALLIPFLIAFGCTYKYSQLKAKLFSFFSVAVLALLVGGWWYIFVRFNDPETYYAVIEKEITNWSSYNVRPFYYYWSFFVQSGIWTIPAFISLIYPYLKSKVRHKKAYTFSFLWTIIAVIFLSLIPEKKSRYLMPVLIPLAINIGFYIAYLVRSFKIMKAKKETYPVYFNFGLIATLAMASPIVIYLALGSGLEGFWIRFIVITIVLFGIGIQLLIQLYKKNMDKIFKLTVLFFMTLVFLTLPLSKVNTNSNYNSVSQLHETARKQDLKIYGFHFIAPEMIWDFGFKIPLIKDEDGSLHFPPEKRFGMLALQLSEQDKKALKNSYEMTKISSFDLNTVASDSQRYNGRLTSQYYILTKK